MLNRAAAMLALALLLAGPALAQDAPLPGIEPPNSLPIPGAGNNGAMEINNSTQSLPDRARMTPVLTVDQDQLFSGSKWGQRVQAELDAAGKRLDAESDRHYKELVEQEAELTELRKTLAPAEFRKRADAFDARATRLRREFAQSVENLNTDLQNEREAFSQAAGPIMGQLMQERGALVVLDRRTALVSVGGINITEELIARIDAELDDGAALRPARTGSGGE